MDEFRLDALIIRISDILGNPPQAGGEMRGSLYVQRYILDRQDLEDLLTSIIELRDHLFYLRKMLDLTVSS